MKQVTIHIPDSKFHFFMELLKSLKFIKKVETKDEGETSKQKILKDLEEAVEEVNQIKAGKLKGKPLREFLDEL